MEFLTALLASEKFTIFATAMLTLTANVVVQLVAVHSSAKAETKRAQRAKHLDEQRAALMAALTLMDALWDHRIALPNAPSPAALRSIFRAHYPPAVRTSMYLVNEDIRWRIGHLYDLLHSDIDLEEHADMDEWRRTLTVSLMDITNTGRRIAEEELNAMGK